MRRVDYSHDVVEDPVASGSVIWTLAQLDDMVDIRDELASSALTSSQLSPRHSRPFFRHFTGSKCVEGQRTRLKGNHSINNTASN